MKMKRKPISRIDSKSKHTHAWFVRIYRGGECVLNRSFSDRPYGSKANAKLAAQLWFEIADSKLPVIPPLPVKKKATVHARRDEKKNMDYLDVYIPSHLDKSWATNKYYYKTAEEERKQRSIANSIVANQNLLLDQTYKKALQKWLVDHDRIMREIEYMKDELKTMPITVG